ncbi:MAG: glycogen/starch synthase [Deltaproteobacteria bacterium]|jgi:starch synthase|nr:glycogen/starch synthase [Deltaproteobacteria bacterium]
MRILFLASELAPLAQTGGLGEAVAGLAAALARLGHDVFCALPGYRDLLRHPECPALAPAEAVELRGVGKVLRGRWLAGRLPTGVELRALELSGLYDGPGLYAGDASDARRFIALGRAGAQLASHLNSDVLVAHDWHAALAPCVLRAQQADAATRARNTAPTTVQVVHNGAYSGRFGADQFAHTALPSEFFGPNGVEFYGGLCLLKAGLLFSDRIVAVSPTYARELCTSEFGGGLDGVYRARADRLVGIRNGIDTQSYAPETDAALAARFSVTDTAGRARCRTALLDELELANPPAGRLIASVGRLASQKGWDVLADALDGLVAGGAALALLGEGDPQIAASLEDAAVRHPGRVRLVRGWDPALSRRIYAGADALLVPSRFEPCGLVQLLAQRYGCLPVANRVGGLVDTIVDGETGLLFAPLEPDALIGAAERAAGLLAGPGAAELRDQLMKQDVSWTDPARRWISLLEEAARVAPSARA